MSMIQTGEWRTGSDGAYKVFIRGCEQQVGITVEVITRAGKSSYAVITDTYSKISGGYLYNFYRTGKPKTMSTLAPNNTITVGAPQVRTSTIGKEVSAEELDEALGLD